MGLIAFREAACHWGCVLNVKKNNALGYLSVVVKLGKLDIWSVRLVAPLGTLLSHFDKRFFR